MNRGPKHKIIQSPDEIPVTFPSEDAEREYRETHQLSEELYDDQEMTRLTRAHRALIQQLKPGPAGVTIAVHMGLHSGQAMMGSTRFEGLRGTLWTFTASGPVTNLAARLGAAAAPGTILVGQETAFPPEDRETYLALPQFHRRGTLEDLGR